MAVRQVCVCVCREHNNADKQTYSTLKSKELIFCKKKMKHILGPQSFVSITPLFSWQLSTFLIPPPLNSHYCNASILLLRLYIILIIFNDDFHYILITVINKRSVCVCKAGESLAFPWPRAWRVYTRLQMYSSDREFSLQL